MRKPEPDNGGPFSATFWESVWNDVNDSFLAASQRRHPERWRRFYDSHGFIMRAISGIEYRQGQSVVEILQRENLVVDRCKVVDLGCGTGWLALPIAMQGARVLAVDASSRILEVLSRQTEHMRVGNLELQNTCWTRLKPGEPYDLVLAACFPPALCPGGIARMESLGRHCALLLAAGDQELPWARNLWMRICGHFPFSGGRYLQTALNYLLAKNRLPGFMPIPISYGVDVPIDQAMDFYTAYFSLFDMTGPQVAAAIDRELGPFVHRCRLKATGEARYGLVWWAP